MGPLRVTTCFYGQVKVRLLVGLIDTLYGFAARSDYTSSIAQKVRFAHIESNKNIDKKKTTKCEFNLLTGSGGKMRLCITVYSIAHSCGDRIMGETHLRETEFT